MAFRKGKEALGEFQVVVCVKAVPDPKQSHLIRIDPVTRCVVREAAPLVLNPLDRHALEEGLRVRERFGGRVSVVSMGPPQAREVLREALSLGADEAYLLSDRAFAGADAYATAYTLSLGIRRLAPFRLILCGAESSDGSTAQVGPGLAQFLGVPHVVYVDRLDLEGNDRALARARMDHGFRLVEVDLPALVTVTREINRPRGITFSGVVRARNRTITEWGAADLGAEPEKVGAAGSPTVIADLYPVESRRQAEIWEGEAEEAVRWLRQRLQDRGLLSRLGLIS